VGRREERREEGGGRREEGGGRRKRKGQKIIITGLCFALESPKVTALVFPKRPAKIGFFTKFAKFP
jgi:hypothetical protein